MASLVPYFFSLVNRRNKQKYDDLFVLAFYLIRCYGAAKLKLLTL